MLKNGIMVAENLMTCQKKQRIITTNILPCRKCGKKFKASSSQKYNNKNGKMIFCSNQCYRLNLSEIRFGKRNPFYGKTSWKKVVAKRSYTSYKWCSLR